MQALVITINETYPKSGDSRKYARRDLRRGGIEGGFETSKDGHPSVRYACILSVHVWKMEQISGDSIRAYHKLYRYQKTSAIRHRLPALS